MADKKGDKINEKLLWPDNHYGLNNRAMMAKNRGELHLGEDGPEDHAEYIREDAPIAEMKGQQATKNPTKGNSKG